MTNAEARFNNSLRPRKPEGSLGRTAQDGHLDSHTVPELCCEFGHKIIRIILYLLIEVAFLFAYSIETLNAVTGFYVSAACGSESQLKLRLFPRCVPLNIATKHYTNRTARYTYTVKQFSFPLYIYCMCWIFALTSSST